MAFSTADVALTTWLYLQAGKQGKQGRQASRQAGKQAGKQASKHERYNFNALTIFSLSSSCHELLRHRLRASVLTTSIASKKEFAAPYLLVLRYDRGL